MNMNSVWMENCLNFYSNQKLKAIILPNITHLAVPSCIPTAHRDHHMFSWARERQQLFVVKLYSCAFLPHGAAVVPADKQASPPPTPTALCAESQEETVALYHQHKAKGPILTPGYLTI